MGALYNLPSRHSHLGISKAFSSTEPLRQNSPSSLQTFAYSTLLSTWLAFEKENASLIQIA